MDGIIHVIRYDLDTCRSINDLAEAVRVKCLEAFKLRPPASHLRDHLMETLFWEGPLAFIRSVRGVIDD